MLPFAAFAQPGPALHLEVMGGPLPAIQGKSACDSDDIPDIPARALHLADGTVELYAGNQRNRVERGADLLHVKHDCTVVMTGSGSDDPAAYNDRAWIAAPWTPDGITIFAVIYNEFHGQLRPTLCPTRRYMDCWFNALTAAVSHDGGRSFQRAPGHALVATLPYRFEQLGLGHHGYFNPSNIVSFDGAAYMFAFATRANAQQEGNCLLRTTRIWQPESWRAWDGTDFAVAFADPYTEQVEPERHVCSPVAPASLRWPVTSLVRHRPTGQFIATMLNGARGGGVYYATSPDLVHWSPPALLMPAIGLGAWTCADSPPIFYPSLLDPASADRNFETVADAPVLFATRFKITSCRTSMDRQLIRWSVHIAPS